MKKLVLIGGPAGSGKGYISEILIEKLRAVRLDKDVVSRHLTERLLVSLGCSKNDRESEVYLNHVEPLEYEALEYIAIDNITLESNHVVCSAPFASKFLDEGWLDDLADNIAVFDVELILIWVQSDSSSAYQRIVSRNSGRDEWKLANWHLHNQNTSYLPPATKRHMFVLDNTQNLSIPLDVQINEIFTTLDKLQEARILIDAV